jgi:hypothetical protein
MKVDSFPALLSSDTAQAPLSARATKQLLPKNIAQLTT